MEFTFIFIRLFFESLLVAAPLLVFEVLLVCLLGQIAGWRESWNPFESLYWTFITATTVGYGDIRPARPLSRTLAVFIAFNGLIFTGIMVALAIHAATVAFDIVSPVSFTTELLDAD